MGALDGGIRAIFGEVFGSFYQAATLVRVTLVPDGEGGGTTTEATEPIKVQQDSVDERTRAEAGYAQNERKFLILQNGVTGPVTGDCRLIFEGVDYMLSSPEQDPARSYWAVRGVPSDRYVFSNAEAASLAARFTTPATDARKAIIDSFVGALKAAGVWTKLDALYVMAAADSQAARQNWIANQYNLTAVAGPTFTADRGYAGDGSSSYLTTALNLSTASKFTQNSACLGLYSRTAGALSSSELGARIALGNTMAQMLISTAAFIPRLNISASGGNVDVAVNSAIGDFQISRTGSATVQAYEDGVSIGPNQPGPSVLPPNLELYICATNQNGSAMSFSPRQIASVNVGSGLSGPEIAALAAARLIYLQAVGAA